MLQVVARVDPAKEWHGMYQDFHLGVGGACSVYDPPVSPWCSSSFYSLRILSEMHTRCASVTPRHPACMRLYAAKAMGGR